ncbi:MAG TPA: SURF1 family protein [Natronosporangium sp.]|nr:SURF1 family protein [Natronosporangium sp.]
MYRFLFTPAWLGRLAVALVLATVMGLLGGWQLSRYEERSAINARIDAATAETAAPLTEVLTAPSAGASPGPAPPEEALWSMVTATGRYDPDHEILVRGRTVSGQVGYEVLTPLVLPDGAAVLINRGWVPPGGDAAGAHPEVPPASTGQVTVAGRVRPSESGSRPVETIEGVTQTRRIHLDTLAAALPYPIYGGYLQLDTQDPPADDALTPIPVRRENALLNAAYTVQWWLFAVLVLVGFGVLARKEATRGSAPAAPKAPAPPVPPVAGSNAETGRGG